MIDPHQPFQFDKFGAPYNTNNRWVFIIQQGYDVYYERNDLTYQQASEIYLFFVTVFNYADTRYNKPFIRMPCGT